MKIFLRVLVLFGSLIITNKTQSQLFAKLFPPKTKPLTISVGKVKFESDIDENYSICKVIEGGDKINQLINQKEKIYCRLVSN